MSRLLVIGTGPLYSPEVCRFNGQGLRTWQFASCLLQAGHEVTLVVLPAEGHDLPFPGDARPIHNAVTNEFEHYLVNSHDWSKYLPVIEQLAERCDAQGIVAVNHNAACPVCMMETNLPIWADLNGYMMGEAQAKACVYDSDDFLSHFWRRQRRILRRADRFSAVSRRQMYATIGELGALGRLNRHNVAHNFVVTVPNAMAPQFLHPPCRNERFRGTVFPRDAFAVLWSGGFNTWTDPVMLADTLAYAMVVEPSLHFVATGGSIPGHDDRTYSIFVDEMTQRGLAGRCTLLGWIENERIFDLYRNCDLGMCLDGVNYETLMGARNRITNMVAMQLPVLTTLGTEISEELDAVRGALVVEPGDPRQMADQLVYAAHNSTEMREMAQRAFEFAEEHWTIETATRPLLKWAAKPKCAPDNAERCAVLRKRRDADVSEPYHVNPMHISVSGLDEESRIADTHDVISLSVDSRDLRLIRGKLIFRMWKGLCNMPRALWKIVAGANRRKK